MGGATKAHQRGVSYIVPGSLSPCLYVFGVCKLVSSKLILCIHFLCSALIVRPVGWKIRIKDLVIPSKSWNGIIKEIKKTSYTEVVLWNSEIWPNRSTVAACPSRSGGIGGRVCQDAGPPTVDTIDPINVTLLPTTFTSLRKPCDYKFPLDACKVALPYLFAYSLSLTFSIVGVDSNSPSPLLLRRRCSPDALVDTARHGRLDLDSNAATEAPSRSRRESQKSGASVCSPFGAI